MSKETVETYANALEKFNEKEKKIENFNEMLLSIKDLDDKRRIRTSIRIGAPNGRI